MASILSNDQKQFFLQNGYLLVPNLLNMPEVENYRDVYADFLSNKIDASRYRSDLAGSGESDSKTEKITQIMIPSRLDPTLLNKPLHVNSLSIAKQLLGDDIILDFDMLIDKAPYTNAPTPWHQDCAYWITMPDTRSVSCWVALDMAVKENGCMWYIPKSHLLPIRPHTQASKGGGALECAAHEEEGVAVEIAPGDAIFHHGGTAHYSRGNATDKRRRAFITNFRPEAMVAYERAQGYDHTGEREIKDERAK